MGQRRTTRKGADVSFEIDRRNLLRTGAVLGAVAALDGCRRGADDDDGKAKRGARPASPAEAALPVLTAVAERILPSDGAGPGAREANVGGFLENALADRRLAHLRPLLQRGAAFLDDAAREERAKSAQPAGGFTALSDEQRDELLERLARRELRPTDFDGNAFVRIMVALTLEGFLGDPKHGGNEGRAAWTWLGFDPAGRNAIAHAGGHATGQPGGGHR